MLKYTLCFIRQEDRYLLLNREYSPWMEMWNAPGGKLEPGETPRESALREIREETGILLESVAFRGIVTWLTDGKAFEGMYIYHADLPPAYRHDVPVRTPEGILDWKKTEWILHPGNPGVTPNVAHCVRLLADGTGLFELRCHYEGDRLIRTEMLELDRDFEQLTDRQRIEEMLLGR